MALRQRLERLLARHESDHELLDQPPAELLAAIQVPSQQSEQLDAPASAVAQLAPLLTPSARPAAAQERQGGHRRG